jgi:hypothetical protein
MWSGIISKIAKIFMATVINNPSRTASEDTGTGLGVILGVILIVALAVLLFVFGLRNQAPAGTTDIPNRIDVNLNGGANAPAGNSTEGAEGAAQ